MSELPPDLTPDKSHRKGGRKAGPVANKQRHVISVRLTDAEYLRLTGEAEKYKRKLGEVLRAVWLNQRSVTKLSVPPTVEHVKQRVQLAEMATQVHGLVQQEGHSDATSKALFVVLSQLNLMLA